MFSVFKKLFAASEQPREAVNIPIIIQQIQEREADQEIPLGRRIHSFSYQALQLYLDRDITEQYRVTVYRGQDRIYSFTIFADQNKYDILEQGYGRIISFLDGDRKVADLPDDDILKGFFYGH